MFPTTNVLGRSAALNPSILPIHLTESAAEDTGTRTIIRPRRRTYSNSSDSSVASAQSEDQFVFSPHRSPSHEQASFFPPPTKTAATAARRADPAPPNPDSDVEVGGGPKQGVAARDISKQTSRQLADSNTTTKSAADGPPTPRSKPIAIELPPSLSRKIASSSVYTPIEPLSARGDISGGYFPFHEDPDERIHRPHPFHEAAKAAKRASEEWQHEDPQSSRAQASRAQAISAKTRGEPSTAAIASASRPSVPKPAVSKSKPKCYHPKSVKMPPSRGASHNTPVASYNPSGLGDIPIPMGKYYPSNYEAARARKQAQSSSSSPSSSSSRTQTSRSSLRPPFAADTTPCIKSDTAVPQLNRPDAQRERSDSEAKRRLQQYQRDMVAQATQAARQLANSNGVSANLASVHGVTLQKFDKGPNGPISPRLQPLGSPGPVTPMELENHGGDGGYLSRGRPVPSPDAGRELEAVARAMRAENERRRREGRSSPAVEAGGFLF